MATDRLLFSTLAHLRGWLLEPRAAAPKPEPAARPHAADDALDGPLSCHETVSRPADLAAMPADSTRLREF
jgi:hypothetical protein